MFRINWLKDWPRGLRGVSGSTTEAVFLKALGGATESRPRLATDMDVEYTDSSRLLRQVLTMTKICIMVAD